MSARKLWFSPFFLTLVILNFRIHCLSLLTMMSKKCKYAIKALMRLAKNYNEGHLQTADIAAKENIPKKFLEQILLELKHARMVSSKQGSGGGYFLIKDPKDVSIAEIYRLFDGAIALLPCVSLNFYEKCDDCTNESECAMQREFIKIREGARVVMSQTTIASLLN
jgi:Rrf2 family protein